VPPRQRSLEAVITWSYDLRSSAEQRVLRRLAVFPDSFDAAAAEVVAGGEVLPALARLVDASLLAADPPRYRLLRTVRTYARERLREGLSLFWFRSGYVRDGRVLLDRAMAAAGSGGPLWGRALVGRAALAQATGSADALAASAPAVEAAEGAADGELLALALCWRGHALLVVARRAEARDDLRRARSVAVLAVSDEGIALADMLLGDLLAPTAISTRRGTCWYAPGTATAARG